MKILVGITGASGSIYAVRLLEELLKHEHKIHAVFSRTGEQIMQFECDAGKDRFPGVVWHDPDNMFAAIASGSALIDNMVIVPCSVHSLSCIAHGISNNLLQRSAAVMLKERRSLIVVPRETPVDQIALESMLKLARAGATILPASPGFYHRPQTLDDLVNHVVGKILSCLNIDHELFTPWTDPKDV